MDPIESSKSLPMVLVIDDEKFYRDEVLLELKDRAIVKTYLGPSDFEKNATKEDISKAAVILVDYDFKHANAIELRLSEKIRASDFKEKLILWSLFTEFEEIAEILKKYDAVYEKSDFGWIDKYLVTD